MRLTPDEIASRAFTPSVDGYHQGEVRSFLERVSAEVSASQLASPAGSAEVAGATAVPDREPRLAELERKLGELIADLAAATDRLHQTSTGSTGTAVAAGAAGAGAAALASSGGGTSQLQSERQALADLQSALREQHESLVAQQQSLSEQQQAFLAKQAAFDEQQQTFLAQQEDLSEQQLALAEQQQAFTASQTALAEQQQALADQQQSLNEQQEMLGEHLDDTRRLAAATPPPAAAAPAAPAPVRSEDSTPEVPAPAPTASVRSEDSGIIPQSLRSPAQSSRPTVAAAADQAEALSLFASDLDDQPLFSDNANDLLDGVLDDVMGNITDEGTSP